MTLSRDPLRRMEFEEFERLRSLRRLLNEPALLDVEVFRHAGATWWRLHVGCRCFWTGADLPGCDHPVQLRMVPGGEFRKRHRLARRLQRPVAGVTDADARRVVAALYGFVNARGQ